MAADWGHTIGCAGSDGGVGMPVCEGIGLDGGNGAGLDFGD